jgi:hypothetical protein
VRTLQYFQNTLKKKSPENIKNCSQKLLIIGPFFFSVLPTGPKSDQISYFFQKNGSLRDFYTMTLNLTVGDENDSLFE